jgi:hypothetical protein
VSSIFWEGACLDQTLILPNSCGVISLRSQISHRRAENSKIKRSV